MSRFLALMLGALVLAPAALAQDAPAQSAPTVAAQGPSSLMLAYQKEFAFLSAELDSLRAQLDALDTRSGQDIAAAELLTASLEERLIAASLRVERSEALLDDLDRQATGAEEAAQALTGTLSQASETVALQVPPENAELAQQSEALLAAFTGVSERLTQASAVRSEPGSWFLADGTKVDGTVYRVGAVAAYGVSDEGTGALMPAGQGHLRLAPYPGEAVAKGLAGGSLPATTGVFLYENPDKAITLDDRGWIEETLDNGGLIGNIILVLGACAFLMIGLRAVSLTRQGQGADKRIRRITAAVAKGDLEAARALSLDGRSVQRVIGSVLARARTGHKVRKMLEDTLSEAILGETPRLERFATAVMVIAAVSPLLGLLGTVTGMIATFDVITEFGTGDPKMLSGGISEALVTTQLGLCVAIPALVLGNLLNAKATGMLDMLERGALEVMNLLEDGPTELVDDDSEEQPVPMKRAAHA